MNVTRAYRLGKSETLYDFARLLVDGHYSAWDLQREIVGRMHDLGKLDRNAILRHKHVHLFQESQGRADACIGCFDLIATQKLSGEALSCRITESLFAIWPPDYLEYRRRYMAGCEEDPTLPATVGLLDLRSWYDAVDALQVEMTCAEATGLPPSEEQETLAVLLFCTAGERIPCERIPGAD